MIARIGRSLVAAVMLAAAIGTGELVAPHNVFACSCAQIGKLADLVGKPEVFVLTGTIHDVQDGNSGQHGTFSITRVFQGSVPAAVMPIRGGGGGDCTVDLRQAVNVVMVTRIEDGMVVPGLCSPFGDLSTPEGQALLAEANATWAAPTAPVDSPVAQPFDMSLVAILLVTVLVVVVLAVAIVAVLRQRDTPTSTT